MKIIDISVPVDDKTPRWPGSPGPKLKLVSDMKRGRAYNETSVEMNTHTGTHIDAPSHFISSGKSIDRVAPGTFIGAVLVAHVPGVKRISAADLEKLKIPTGVKRILFKTSNSVLWKKRVSEFKKGYVGITSDAAAWLSKRNFKLIGIDYLSVAKFDETAEVHRILLKKAVLLESVNLSKVKPGMYELICLPIKMTGAEASPTRAVLIKK